MITAELYDWTISEEGLATYERKKLISEAERLESRDGETNVIKPDRTCYIEGYFKNKAGVLHHHMTSAVRIIYRTPSKIIAFTEGGRFYELCNMAKRSK